MDIKLPTSLDFLKLVIKCECGRLLVKKADGPFKDCECGITDIYLRKWVVSVPSEDSMVWAVVVSFLLSANLGDDAAFQQKLEFVTGVNKNPNSKDIKMCLSRFNPFLNRHSCFFNKNLQDAVHVFKRKLNNNSDVDFSIYDELKVVSHLLKCSILLLKPADEKDVLSFISFPQKDSLSSIALFLHEDTYAEASEGQLVKRFSFGLKKQLGLKMKKDAFTKILIQAKVYKNMRNKLVKLAENSQNFLISVLQSECRCIIPQLYKTPYFLRKLAEAGFETDPRSVDDQKRSAIYHALSTGDDKLLYCLYDYAANDCDYSENSVRNPDASTLSNLKRLGETFNSFQLVNKQSEAMLLHLIRFNAFHCKITEEILKINEHIEASSNQRLGEIMLAIMKTYNDFFWFDSTNSKEEESLLDDFLTHSNYYENLDYSASHFFFDNIFQLKASLGLEAELSELESSLFFSVLVMRYFVSGTHKLNYFYGKCNNLPQAKVFKSKDFFSHPERKYLLIIPLLERLNLREKIRKFISLLKSSTGHNFLENRPSGEIPLILSQFSEIKDEFQIRKLMYYVETALNAKLKSIKSVLVIEMALQVIGECLIFGERNPFSICRLLSACLNEEIVQKIKHVRNALSHPENYGFAPRFKAENDMNLFHDIKSEIEKIYEAFKVIFDIQQLRVVDFIMNRGLDSLKQQHGSYTSNFFKPFTVNKQLIHAELEIINENNRIQEIKVSVLRKNEIFKNPSLFKNLIEEAKRELEDEAKWKLELDLAEKKSSVNKIIWPLQYLITFLSNDCQVLNAERKNDFENFNHEIQNSNSILELKEIFSRFISIARNIITEIFKEHQKGVKKTQFDKVEAIGKLEKILRGNSFLNEADIKEIMEKIPQDVKDAVLFKERLQDKITAKTPLTDEEYNEIETLTSIFTKTKVDKLKKAYRTDITKALNILISANNPIEDLNMIISENSVTLKLKNFKMLCKIMKFHEDIKQKLSKLYTGLKKKPQEDKIGNILSRVHQLKEILIEENSEICELWNKARNLKTIQYAKQKLVKRYIRESEVQSSVEILLFDCMNILGNQGKLGNLWIKSSNLYSGINLRNVLSHGNPALQGIGKLLDPEDLPSVLVEEMLCLVQDMNILEAIQELCKLTNADFGKFHKIMNDDEDYTYQELRSKISECARWKNYSQILPRITKESVPKQERSWITESEEVDSSDVN